MPERDLLRPRSFWPEWPGSRPDPPGSNRPGSNPGRSRMAVRLETARNANWSIRAFSPPFWPGMETDPPTSGTYPGAASWRDSERTRAARGDGAAHRGDVTARHEATVTASNRTSALSTAFSPVTQRPRLPCPLLSPALGFLCPVA